MDTTFESAPRLRIAPQLTSVEFDSRRRRSAALLAPLLPLLLASCSEPSSGKDAPAGDTPPRDGTIVYHEPESVGLTRRTAPPKTFIFTTAAKGVAQENSFETRSGTLGENADTRDIARKLFATRPATARVISAEKFADLWKRLDEAGLFQLPTYGGLEPPGDQDHFVVQVGKKRKIYTRPEPAEPGDPAVQHLKLWIASKLALFEFVNEP